MSLSYLITIVIIQANYRELTFQIIPKETFSLKISDVTDCFHEQCFETSVKK